jgi:glycosyltransferase involved in cell wall biosynthesis
MQNLPTYVLITPARNEGEFIEFTLKSVMAQTVRPIKWIIVSDGSTDDTDEIVRSYADKHPWIELVRMPERHQRSFAAKVYAFEAGYARVSEVPYQAIGSLDGDLSFDKDYFEFLLRKLMEEPSLGLVGTPFRDSLSNETYDYRFVNIEHVSGACQLFRRECFEDIGRYLPVKRGGIDYIAVVTSRMKGWKTRTFTEKCSVHHRHMGTAQQGVLAARFKYGSKDYALGNHPVWELFRSVYQMSKWPFLIGGLLMLCGYMWALMLGEERPVSREVIAFVRREQMQRLGRFLTAFIGPRQERSSDVPSTGPASSAPSDCSGS